MSMIELQEIIDTAGKPWAVERARLAFDLSIQRGREEISEDEYKELMGDLIATDKLDAEADDLEMKTMLVTAISGVAKLA